MIATALVALCALIISIGGAALLKPRTDDQHAYRPKRDEASGKS
jgi:hypothetical protein